MDNLTHSLAAIAVAETTYFHGASKTSGLRRALWLGSLLANNLSDADILYSWISGPKIGYLLHHRGHTHTLVAALPQALLVLFLVWLWQRRSHTKLSAKDWRQVAGITLFGFFLHLGMDSLNSYGVHPFWPWDNRWYYGDSVFIIEPYLWFSLLPAVLWMPGQPKLTGFFRLLALGGLALVWGSSFLPREAAVALTVFSVGMVAGFSWLPMRLRGRVSLCTALLIVSLFQGVSHWVRAQANSALAVSPTVWSDVILSPFPANPLCWSLIAVGELKENYALVAAVWAPFPRFRRADQCRALRPLSAYVKIGPPDLAATPQVVWYGRYEYPLDRFEELRGKSCLLRAALRFYRSPVFGEKNGETFVADLRFGGGGFSELPLTPGGECPVFLPPWEAPLKKNTRE